MNRPCFNRHNRDQITAPPREREAAAVKLTAKHLELLEQRLASHGADGLPAWLTANLGAADRTTKASALLRIMRAALGRDVLAACREALP